MVIGLALSASAFAKEKAAADKGGLEMSGSVMTGLGFQYTANANGAANVYLPTDSNGVVYYPGVMGAYVGQPTAPKQKNFDFFVDSVYLDLMKSFGENIKLRADLKFGRATSSGIGANAFDLDQAYATANIPVGSGIEVLIGRFHTPIGFESAVTQRTTSFPSQFSQQASVRQQ